MGYQAKDRKITVVEQEAKTVRHIFRRYLELGSLNLLLADLRTTGVRTKVRPLSSGRTIGGIPFTRGSLACRFQKLDSCVPVMQSAQDCMGDDVPEALDRAPVRCILAERNMRTPPIIIGGEFRKNPPKVFFIEHDQMIGAFAPDRPDQALNMAVLPGRAE